MKLSHTFELPVAPDVAWEALTDLERMAVCMPGASLEAKQGDQHVGRVKVKLGGMTSEFRGTARFDSRDDEAHRCVILAEGSETHGQGGARATVEMALAGQDSRTEVTVLTTLDTVGRFAQFGRGVLQDVSQRLLQDFLAALESQLPSAQAQGPAAATREPHVAEQGQGGGAQPPAAALQSAPRTAAAARDQDEAVDLGPLVGPILMRRVLPVICGVAGVATGVAATILARRMFRGAVRRAIEEMTSSG